MSLDSTLKTPIKQLLGSYDEMPFALAIVRKALDVNQTSWDIEFEAMAALAYMTKNNPGKVLHAIDTLDPKPGDLITLNDVMTKLPAELQAAYMSSEEEPWLSYWVEFSDKDQRRVFRASLNVDGA